MLPYIAEIAGTVLISMLAHKILSLAFILFIGFAIYIGFTNPELISKIVLKAKEMFDTFGQGKEILNTVGQN